MSRFSVSLRERHIGHRRLRHSLGTPLFRARSSPARAWKQTGDRQYDATYIALRFDDAKKFIGTQQTRIRITQGAH